MARESTRQRGCRLQLATCALILLMGVSLGPNPAHGDAVESMKQAANDASSAIRDAVSPAPPSFADQVKEQLNKAGTQLQSMADQITAQFSKRSRRQAQQHSGSHVQESHSSHQYTHQTGGQNAGGSPPSSEISEKLDNARQLVQKIRERCLSGLEQQRQKEQSGLRQPSEYSPIANSRVPARSEHLFHVEERSSSGIPLAKLGEHNDKVKNNTDDARQLVQNIRLRCAEILGGNSQRAPLRVRRQASAQTSLQQPVQPNQVLQSSMDFVSQAGGQAAAALSAFGGQLRDQTSAAVFQLQGLRDQMVAGVERQIPKRVRRQIQYPTDGQQGAAGTGSSTVGSFMKYLNDLNQQANQAQAISQFLQGMGVSGSQGPSASGQASTGSTLALMLTQLSDLIKSTQNRGARLVESNQRNLESAGQQTMEAARTAQTGVQAAIGEMTQGLQRLATNNPNLLPDIKSLYQSVTSRLSTASNQAQSAAAGGINQAPASQV